jgi:uncharacterized membrane-anchored protein YitT (DUF2179 family)
MIKGIIKYFKSIGLKRFLNMNFGLLCSAIATVIFITPSRLVAGGTTGLSVLLESITNIHYYYFMYGINIFLIIIAFIFIGKDFAIKTIYGSLMLPTYGILVTEVCNLIPNFNILETVSGVEAVFVVLFAALLMGLGIGINMKNGGSTGGFDILETLGLKYLHIPYSTSMYILDALLIVSGIVFYDATAEHLVFENGFSEGLGATIYVFLLGFVVDTITFGGYNKRAVFIRSSKYEEVHDAIINKLVRGLTYLDATGGYTNTPTKMIVTICYSREYFKLRQMVAEIDPEAFIFVTRAEEVRGLGFNYETPEYKARHSRKKGKQ